MNAGAEAAAGNVLLFLHADSTLPADADRLLVRGMADHGRHWGRFDVRLSGRHRLLRVVEFMMNWRSRLTNSPWSPVAMAVSRAAFVAVGGFPAIALMEDIAISRALKMIGPPLCLRARIVTSSRRWERHGILRTILTMWRLRLRYFLGADPTDLARAYYGP
jgi:hypothetical protein